MLDRMRITLAATILSGSLLFSNYDTNIVYAKQKPDIVDATSQGSSLENRIKKISVSYSDEDFAYNQSYEKAKNIVTHLSSKKQFPSNTWEIIALSHISEGLVNYEQNHPDKKLTELSKVLGDQWKALSDKEKKVYQDKAEEAKATYAEVKKAYDSKKAGSDDESAEESD